MAGVPPPTPPDSNPSPKGSGNPLNQERIDNKGGNVVNANYGNLVGNYFCDTNYCQLS